VLSAAVQKVRPKPITFKVTPKGAGGLDTLPVRLILPFVVITATLSTAALVGEFSTLAVGYVGLCLFGALVYAVVSLSVCLLHVVEAARMAGAPPSTVLAATVKAPLAVSLAVLIPLAVAIAHYPVYAVAVLGW
jgi:predicted Co/Zn/Cd cation transporter (cation efflux family)